MPESPPTLRRTYLVAGVVVAAVLLGWGCGSRAAHRPRPAAPQPCRSGLLASVAVAAPAPPAVVQTSPVPTSPALPAPGTTATYPYRQRDQKIPAAHAVLACRQYRLPSDLAVYDYSDRLAALIHQSQSYPYYCIYLFNLDRGTLRLALPGPVSAVRGCLVMEVRLSDTWMVWEEVGGGDDTVRPVHWYLYAAPVRADDLTIGEPFLVDKGFTSTRSRPLWELAGGVLAWSVNEGAQRNPRGFLGVTDLACHRRLFVRRSPSRLPFPSVGIADGRVWVSELCRRGQYPLRVRVYAQTDGRLLAVIKLHNRRALEKLVAMHGRWLAWAVAWDGDMAGSDLFALELPGRPRLLARSAIEPCFVGHYLFFQISGPVTSGVDGYDLDSRTRFRVARTVNDTQGAWFTGMHATATRCTLVVDNPFFQDIEGDSAAKYSPVRVYKIQPQKEGT